MGFYVNEKKIEKEYFIETSLVADVLSEEEDIWGENNKSVSHAIWSSFFLSLDATLSQYDQLFVYAYIGGEKETFSKVWSRLQSWFENTDAFLERLTEKIKSISIVVDEKADDSSIPFITALSEKCESKATLRRKESCLPKYFPFFFKQNKRESIQKFTHFLYIEGQKNNGKKVLKLLRCEENPDDHKALWSINPRFVAKEGYEEYEGFREYFESAIKRL